MKKSLILLFASFSFVAVNAQIKNDRGTFTKPKKGDIISEINFSPSIGGNNPSIFSLPNVFDGIIGVKARKFISDKKAYRYVGNFQVESTSGGGNSSTTFLLAAGFGIENHMKGAERLSTYWGYEGKIGIVNGPNALAPLGLTPEQQLLLEQGLDQQDEDTPPIPDPTTGDIDASNDSPTKGTRFGIGGNVFTGFDYYFIPNVYLGAEVSYGLGIVNDSRDGGSATRIALAPSVSATFRLGWRF